ncbi:MAG TPA: GxGYxYP family putative glycoside hydrolase [Kiritimatiellia bacterium]|nr:GxGYxYP family putative glycoside hydrolase [Kiritimatiellia bacterium]HMP32769.1 GxGYxYP family putative glycoside hydrolase [Kiritimatiellia bacterium]
MNHSLTTVCLARVWPWLTAGALALTACQPGHQTRTGRAGPEPVTVYRVDAEAFGDDERLAAVALQGIANRDSARVFLDYGNSLRWMQIDYEKQRAENGGRVFSREDAETLSRTYKDLHDFWIAFYEEQRLCRFETVTMPELIEKMRDEIKGVILYSNVTDDLALVATMAGVRDAVPLTEALYRNWVEDKPYAVPVIFDVRDLYAGYPAGVERRLAAHRWMIDNLYAEVNKSGAVSRDRTYGLAAHDTLVDIDLAVSLRWVTFDLSFMSEETRNTEKKDPDKPHPVWGFEPPDKPLLIEILEGLDDWAPVYGWGRPYESALIRRLAIHRTVKICGGTANGSFFRHMPKLTDDFRLDVPHVEKPMVKPKYYVAFMVNEGDTIKCMASLMNSGSWLQSERGKIAINWGIDPLLIRDTPGLMSYYYYTATEKDYFFSAPSGWGYLAPINLKDEDVVPYGRMVKTGADMADTRYIDVWWMSGLRSRDQFFPLLEAMGMRGLTQWSNRQEVEFAPDGTPVIHSNYYYPRFTAEDFAKMLIDQTAEVKPPWFIVVYAGNPHWFYEVARRLPERDFEVVKLDEFFEAARAAQPLVEGRSWIPPKDRKKTVVD